MDIQLWMVGQILIDALLVGVLLWLIVTGNRRRIRDMEAQMESLRRSGEILAEMREIAGELEGNLEEKRELTHRLLGRLDETLDRAERRCEQLNALCETSDSPLVRDQVSLDQTHATRQAIRSLLDRGLSKEEAAQRLGLSVAEIDLFLKLGAAAKS